jgi:hypothetical protein
MLIVLFVFRGLIGILNLAEAVPNLEQPDRLWSDPLELEPVWNAQDQTTASIART